MQLEKHIARFSELIHRLQRAATSFYWSERCTGPVEIAAEFAHLDPAPRKRRCVLVDRFVSAHSRVFAFEISAKKSSFDRRNHSATTKTATKSRGAESYFQIAGKRQMISRNFWEASLC